MPAQHDYDGIRYREEQHAPNLFRILFTILILWGVAFSGYYLFSGWSSQGEADAAKKALELRKQAALNAAGPASLVADGRQIFVKQCAVCHGENAKGGVGPDLTAPAYRYGRSRVEIVKSIGEGRPDGMPGFGGQLNRGEIEALAEYLLSLK